MSRVDFSRIAAWKAAEAAKAAGLPKPRAGSVVASDAFFPFADGLLAAAEAGATAVIQPGGSMRDDEVIQAADEAGLAMVFTGIAISGIRNGGVSTRFTPLNSQPADAKNRSAPPALPPASGTGRSRRATRSGARNDVTLPESASRPK